jgi:hypothetical protein
MIKDLADARKLAQLHMEYVALIGKGPPPYPLTGQHIEAKPDQRWQAYTDARARILSEIRRLSNT